MYALNLSHRIFTELPGAILALTGTGTIKRGLSFSSNSAIFNVSAFGARGDGRQREQQPDGAERVWPVPHRVARARHYGEYGHGARGARRGTWAPLLRTQAWLHSCSRTWTRNRSAAASSTQPSNVQFDRSTITRSPLSSLPMNTVVQLSEPASSRGYLLARYRDPVAHAAVADKSCADSRSRGERGRRRHVTAAE